jgi:hypothetical protein
MSQNEIRTKTYKKRHIILISYKAKRPEHKEHSTKPSHETIPNSFGSIKQNPNKINKIYKNIKTN